MENLERDLENFSRGYLETLEGLAYLKAVGMKFRLASLPEEVREEVDRAFMEEEEKLEAALGKFEKSVQRITREKIKEYSQ